MPATPFTNRRAGLIVAAAMLVAASACNRSSPTVDASLKADLQAANGDLANHGVSAQLVISPLEATPMASPTRAAPKRTPQVSSKPTVRVADKPAINPAPAPVVSQATAPVQSAPTAAAPAPSEPAPIAQPVRGPAKQQPGVYKTEGEIFRQMPWIRP